MTIALEPDLAPQHVAQIKALAREGAYDNVAFHRVIDGFMAQTGDVQYGDMNDGYDPMAAGMGSSDKPDLPAEFSKEPFKRGTVGMARAQDPNSANSQFFITFGDASFLNGQYTVVGEVESGMEAGRQHQEGRPGQQRLGHRSGPHDQGARRRRQQVTKGFFDMAEIKDRENALIMETTKGKVVIELFPDLAPGHVGRIKELAREGAYDGVVFHRVIDGFMAQTGDVKFGKTGGKDFNPARRHGRLQQAGPQGRVLQHEPRPRHLLDGARRRTRTRPTRSSSSASTTPASSTASTRSWGQVIEGMENVDKIKRGEPVQDPDKIVSLKVAADVK